MAKAVMLRHPESGLGKKGFYGFSWTTLFFGAFPALFRGDFLTFVGGFAVFFIVSFVALSISGILFVFIAPLIWIFMWFAWALKYNAYYITRLIERGYRFDDDNDVMQEAGARLGVTPQKVARQPA